LQEYSSKHYGYLADDVMDEQEINRRKLLDGAINPYPNDFNPNTTIKGLIKSFGSRCKEYLDHLNAKARLAGRVCSIRNNGKIVFFHISNVDGKVQAFCRSNNLTDHSFNKVKTLNIGDIVGIEGAVIKTNSGELSVKTTDVKIITRCLKVVGKDSNGHNQMMNKDSRYRNRHLDMISNGADTFIARAKIISEIRKILNKREFLEVETPMLHEHVSGASANPFNTHHNSLHIDLHLRVAPELYLKKAVVGGIERVYEINKSFRNEGVDSTHNPEFTMLEFYQAYATMEDGIELTSSILNKAGRVAGRKFTFRRVSMVGLVAGKLNESPETITSNKSVLMKSIHDNDLSDKVKNSMGCGALISILFESLCEKELDGAVFVTDYPAEVSPLARERDTDSFFADRFELFIDGMEVANGYSELNDPRRQKEKFEKQGSVDQSYIDALECGMPSAVGVGIGIDRLVMVITGKQSIREVLMFPQMRPL